MSNYMTPFVGGFITKERIEAAKASAKVGDMLKDGIVTGIYPFFLTYQPYKKYSGKLETMLWAEYFKQMNK